MSGLLVTPFPVTGDAFFWIRRHPKNVVFSIEFLLSFLFGDAFDAFFRKSRGIVKKRAERGCEHREENFLEKGVKGVTPKTRPQIPGPIGQLDRQNFEASGGRPVPRWG